MTISTTQRYTFNMLGAELDDDVNYTNIHIQYAFIQFKTRVLWAAGQFSNAL